MRAYHLGKIKAPRAVSDLGIGERSVCLEIGCGSGIGALLINQYLNCEKVVGIYICFGFALLRNNLLAIITALIFAVQHSLVVKLEDEELIERFGDEHRSYIRETPATFPRLKNLRGFAKLLGKSA